MELTWQEIMSITELQGLNISSAPSFEPQVPTPYSGPPAPPTYCPCSVHTDEGFSLPLPPYELPASSPHIPDPRELPASTPHVPDPHELPASSPQVPDPPYSYSSMGIPVAKPLTLSGLLNEPIPDPLALLDLGLPVGPPKPQEDPESDSGLSLNYSDAESLELEGADAGRQRNEYVEMYPVEYSYPLVSNSLAYPNYPLLSAEMPLTLEASSGPVRAKPAAVRGEAGSRDERRALAMKIPFPTDKIVNLPVDDFNEMLARYPLTESQLALVRDIRRRGKNKVAAQNCRKRKLETIVQLERELERLGNERERLLRARGEADRTLELMHQQLAELYRDIFQHLRDESGNSYSPEEYVLQQAADGAIFLVPRGTKKEGMD